MCSKVQIQEAKAAYQATLAYAIERQLPKLIIPLKGTVGPSASLLKQSSQEHCRSPSPRREQAPVPGAGVQSQPQGGA